MTRIKTSVALLALLTLPFVAKAQYPGPAPTLSITVNAPNNGWLTWWVNSDPFNGQWVSYNTNAQAVWNTPGWVQMANGTGRGYGVPFSMKGTFKINTSAGYGYVRNP